MPITRHFLGWDRPVLERVAEDLLAATSPPLLDLSHLLVVVPTRNAGRRLREILAHLAHAEGRAILPPQVVPPDFLLSLISHPDSGRAASSVESILGWIPVLKRLPLDDFPALLPVKPPVQDFGWALSTGHGLTRLRDELGEAGLSIGDVATLLSGQLEEEDRWDDLARLEEEYETTLRSFGLASLLEVRKSNASSPQLPAGISGIWLAGCPDPMPLALEVLRVLSQQVEVNILIHAPESAEDDFDAWGRPLPGAWLERIIAFPDDDFPVHVLPNPSAQARLAAEAILSSADPAASITVGILDEEVAFPLERALRARNQEIFNPGGSSLRARGVTHLLKVLRDLLAEESVDDFVELLRCPDFEAYLSSTLLLWDGPAARRQYDELHRQHLFQDLRGLRFFLKRAASGELSGALDELEKILTKLRQVPFSTHLPEVLEGLCACRLAGSDEFVERAYRALADAAQPVLDALAGPVGSALDLDPASALTLLIETLDQETIYEERPAESVELLGWLELHWDDAPHLIITGFNEGFAPEAVTGDIFLPERLRRLIAAEAPFPTNDSRLARDAYLFEALLQCRRERGRVDLCLGKHSQGGDPLRPSRLLFRCRDEDLPSRIKSLFQSAPPAEGDLPWTPGFQLTPFPGTPAPPRFDPATLSVTAFRTYLTSPFQFYLQHVERMRSVEEGLKEMDALAFGNFCHEVLRRFGADPTMRDQTDPKVIRDFLNDTATQVGELTFGRHPHLPVRIQLQSIQQRLSQAAEVQALTRQEGWRNETTELDIPAATLTISGVTITGRIDRLDRHEKSGALRILDYKTSDKPTSPSRAHQAKVSARNRQNWLPPYALFQDGKSTLRWKDLQLPLYRIWLRSSRTESIECGYFHLPKAVTGTAIDVWPEMTETHEHAAQTCAEGIIADLRAGRFWPAPGSAFGDPFSRLHLGIPDQTIASHRLLPSTCP